MITRSPLPIVVAGLAFLASAAQAKTVVITYPQKKATALVAGDTLVVHLAVKSETSSEWHVVYGPEGMLRLSGQPRYLYPPSRGIVVYTGGPATQEFRFTVRRAKQSFVIGAWLRFLFLDRFAPNIKGAKLWQIQYTIKATQ